MTGHQPSHGGTVEVDLTFAERFLLYMLVDHGACCDDDRIEDRVLINSGLAERYVNELTGRGMVRATEAGRSRAQSEQQGHSRHSERA